MNWSLLKKVFVTFEICLLTTSVYIGSSIYSAGTESVAATFGVSTVAATLGLSLFVAGYGLGPMLWSPMSEIPYVGSNPVYLGTLVVFVAFQVPTALASNFGMLLAFRFLTGFFGSPVLATGGASMADLYTPRKRAYAMSIWGISAVCGPTLGPLVGGFAVQYGPLKGGISAPWTWPIWELMWLSAFCLLFLFFFLPETSATNILVRRTLRLRKLTGDQKLTCEPMLMADGMSSHELVMMCLVRPITLNFHEPMVFLLNLYIALIYGLLYIWLESYVPPQAAALTQLTLTDTSPPPKLRPSLHRHLPLLPRHRRPRLPRPLRRRPRRHPPLLRLPPLWPRAPLRRRRQRDRRGAPPPRVRRGFLHPHRAVLVRVVGEGGRALDRADYWDGVFHDWDFYSV